MLCVSFRPSHAGVLLVVLVPVSIRNSLISTNPLSTFPTQVLESSFLPIRQKIKHAFWLYWVPIFWRKPWQHLEAWREIVRGRIIVAVCKGGEIGVGECV